MRCEIPGPIIPTVYNSAWPYNRQFRREAAISLRKPVLVNAESRRARGCWVGWGGVEGWGFPRRGSHSGNCVIGELDACTMPRRRRRFYKPTGRAPTHTHIPPSPTAPSDGGGARQTRVSIGRHRAYSAIRYIAGDLAEAGYAPCRSPVGEFRQRWVAEVALSPEFDSLRFNSRQEDSARTIRPSTYLNGESVLLNGRTPRHLGELPYLPLKRLHIDTSRNAPSGADGADILTASSGAGGWVAGGVYDSRHSRHPHYLRISFSDSHSASCVAPARLSPYPDYRAKNALA